jgi:hypothetical protein
MPFIPRDPRQYRPTNPGQEWLNKLRSGGRITGSMPLLDATGSFTERLAAPGRRKSWQDYNARARSGSYDTPGVRGAPQPGAPRSVSSVISSLRPRSQGFMQEVAQGPPMTDRPPEQVSQNPITGRYDPLPSAAGWNAGAAAGVPQDRTDVGDGGGGGIGGYFRRPGIGAAMTAAGGAMMEAAGKPGASFGGSLGTGLKGFAAERARFQTSEAARRKAAQAGQTTPQELLDRENTVKAMLTQNQVPRDQWDSYLARVVTIEGFTRVLDELAPPGADTAAPRVASLQEGAAITVLRAELAKMDSNDPGYAAKEQELNDHLLTTGIAKLEGDERTAFAKDLADWYALGGPDWEPILNPVTREITNMTPDQEVAAQFRLRGEAVPGTMRRPGSGETTRDRLAAQDSDTWIATGRAKYLDQVGKINESIATLEQSIYDPDLTISGFWTGTVQQVDTLRRLNPEATQVYDNVRSIVFLGLKEALGGSFSEREGDRLVAAAYNPYLPPEYNIARLKRMGVQMQMIANTRDSRARYLQDNLYSLRGWEDPYADAIEGGDLNVAHLVIDAKDYDMISNLATRTQAIEADIDTLNRYELAQLFDRIDSAGEARSGDPEKPIFTETERQLLNAILRGYGDN